MEIVESNIEIAKFMGSITTHGQVMGKDGTYSTLYEVDIPGGLKHHFYDKPTVNGIRDPGGLQYHKVWNWLMPVVEKIQHTWEVGVCRVMDFEITSTGWNGYKTSVRIAIMELKSGNPYHYINITHAERIDAVYQAVIEFIQYYNTQSLTAI